MQQEYLLITGPKDLVVSDVNRFIKEHGYVPLGGLQITYIEATREVFFAQAIVKKHLRG